MGRIGRKLTYANVTATLALLISISGGTAYALAGRNTVFSDDIAPGQVKTADIGTGQVKTADIGTGQVMGSDIADGEVGTGDIGAGQVMGSHIADGEVGTTDIGAGQVMGSHIADGEVDGADVDESTLAIPRVVVEAVSSESSTAAGESIFVLAPCPDGYSVSGGGFFAVANEVNGSRPTVFYDFPYYGGGSPVDHRGWAVEGISTDEGQSLVVKAICERGTSIGS